MKNKTIKYGAGIALLAVASSAILPSVYAEETVSSDVSASVTSTSTNPVDYEYVSNLKSTLTSLENPYATIDSDYKNGKITKATWQKAWNLINEYKRNEMKKTQESNREKMKDVRNETIPEGTSVTSFVRNDLSETEKAEFRSVMDSFGKRLKEVIEDETLSQEAKLEKIKLLNSEQETALKPFIATDKLEAFSAFIASRAEVFAKNLDSRIENRGERKDFVENKNESKKNMQETRKENVQPKQVAKPLLTAKTLKTLNAKLDSIPADKKEAVFTALVQRLETLITATTDVKKKAVLTELKKVIVSKLEAFKSESEQDNILNDILNGTDSNTNTSI